MVEEVQSWLDNPSGNFGWLLKHGKESANRTTKRFNSLQALNDVLRPALTVDFTPPPPPTQSTLSQFVSLIEGSQGGTGSTGMGIGKFTINPIANTLTYTIDFGGLSSAETVSHIHGPAGPGENAAFLHELPLGPSKSGVWTYDEGDEFNILSGKTYVNIHSMNHPDGEIRGQIVDMVALVDAPQESDQSNNSTAQGIGLFIIDTDANILDYYVTFSGLQGTESAAHIHGYTAHGTSTGVLEGLPAGSPKVGKWNYPALDEQLLLDGLTYVNVHSNLHSDGEIRGQITNNITFVDPSQEGGSIVSSAFGVGLFSLDKSGAKLGYHVTYRDLSSAETGAHIHGYAERGASAVILHPLPDSNPKVGAWQYTTTPDLGLLSHTYVNIHTANNPGGEIRGQIEPFDGDILVPVELSNFEVE